MEERFYFKEIDSSLNSPYYPIFITPFSYIFRIILAIIPYPVNYFLKRNSYLLIKGGSLIYIFSGKVIWQTKIANIVEIDSKQREVVGMHDSKGFFIKIYDSDYLINPDVYREKIIVGDDHGYSQIDRTEFKKNKIIKVGNLLENFEYFISRLIEINPNIAKSELIGKYNEQVANTDLRKVFYERVKNILFLNVVGKIFLRLSSGTIIFLIFFIVIFVFVVAMLYEMIRDGIY